jgi:hypothetical protein
MSLPRFEKQGDYWVLTRGLPMAEETLLDTTGSMGNNVDLAFAALPNAYEMLTSGKHAILSRYDPQIATGIFNDTEDNDRTRGSIPVLARSQFEMAEKIALQMSLLTPGRGGCGNGKEDPQFGLFGAAYLTKASINNWGLKYYHFTISDEPIKAWIDLAWLKQIFGDDVLARATENGYEFSQTELPSIAQTIKDLQSRAHAFFLQVDGRADVTSQWTDLYGEDHIVMLEDGTRNLHYVKAVIIGLTEGVLDLGSAEQFLLDYGLDKQAAKHIIRSVAHIPLGAQALCDNFDNIPLAGARFRDKTDLWPVDLDELEISLDPGEEVSEVAGPIWKSL